MQCSQQSQQQKPTISSYLGGFGRHEYHQQCQDDDRAEPQHPVCDSLLVSQHHETGDYGAQNSEHLVRVHGKGITDSVSGQQYQHEYWCSP